jgi:16S rRNA (uracil1498-N3)-methyltransferase
LTTARFYVSEEALRAGQISLQGAEHHHASRVLRMRAGERVILLDGKGCTAHGTIQEITTDRTSIKVDDSAHVSEELPRLHLFQGLPHGTKMDDVVQWGVELGAASLRPFVSSRSRLPDASLAKRSERWRRIALEASRLAGRPFLPEVCEVESWDVALRHVRKMDAALFADEAGGLKPASALDGENPDDLALVIGPEGGFTDEEREDLAAAGARPVTLGDNILRTQTAGMVLLATVRCHYGLL